MFAEPQVLFDTPMCENLLPISYAHGLSPSVLFAFSIESSGGGGQNLHIPVPGLRPGRQDQKAHRTHQISKWKKCVYISQEVLVRAHKFHHVWKPSVLDGGGGGVAAQRNADEIVVNISSFV